MSLVHVIQAKSTNTVTGLYNKKNILVLFITSLLIFGNWSVWIYAVSANKIIDASFGYFIFPILSVLLGFLFGDMFAKGNGWIELNGYVLLPEVRQTMLALVGFYFGSSQVKS